MTELRRPLPRPLSEVERTGLLRNLEIEEAKLEADRDEIIPDEIEEVGVTVEPIEIGAEDIEVEAPDEPELVVAARHREPITTALPTERPTEIAPSYQDSKKKTPDTEPAGRWPVTRGKSAIELVELGEKVAAEALTETVSAYRGDESLPDEPGSEDRHPPNEKQTYRFRGGLFNPRNWF